MRTGYSQKSNDLEFKVDSDSRLVRGYFASFNTLDSDGDIFVKGAFAKSIQERGVNSSGNRKIAHLAFHDMKRPIGDIQVLQEDEMGLYFESKLGTHQDGEDMLKMYREGEIREHSVGFQYMPDKMEEKDGVWYLKEVKLFEGSAVTFGANENTPVIKSAEDFQARLDTLAEEREVLMKLFKSKDSGDLIELEFRKLCFKYESLCRNNPFEAKTVKPNAEPKMSEADALKIAYYKGLLGK